MYVIIMIKVETMIKLLVTNTSEIHEKTKFNSNSVELNLIAIKATPVTIAI